MKKPTRVDRNKTKQPESSNDGGEILIIRWSTRRSMAWKAFISLLTGTFLFWFVAPWWLTFLGVTSIWITAVSDSYFWYVTGMIAIVLSYMGITTFPFWDKFGNRSQVNNAQYEPVDNDDDQYYQPDDQEKQNK